MALQKKPQKVQATHRAQQAQKKQISPKTQKLQKPQATQQAQKMQKTPTAQTNQQTQKTRMTQTARKIVKSENLQTSPKTNNAQKTQSQPKAEGEAQMRTESQHPLCDVLLQLQKHIGRMPTKDDQDKVLAEILGVLERGQTEQDVRNFRAKLGDAIRHHGQKGKKLVDGFTQKAEKVFNAEYLKRIGYLGPEERAQKRPALENAGPNKRAKTSPSSKSSTVQRGLAIDAQERSEKPAGLVKLPIASMGTASRTPRDDRTTRQEVRQEPEATQTSIVQKKDTRLKSSLHRCEELEILVGSKMADLNTRIGVLARNYKANRHLEKETAIRAQLSRPVKQGKISLEVERQARLESLYARILGSPEWQKVWIGIEDNEGPDMSSFQPDRVLQSLFAAGVFQAVFCQASPWHLEQQMKDQFGSTYEYMQRVMGDDGLSQMLKKAALERMADEDFQENVVAPHAKQLACDLADTMMPHLSLYHGQHSIRGTTHGGTEWITDLDGIFKDALILKGLMDASCGASFEMKWFKPGDEGDGKVLKPSSQGADSLQAMYQVHLTLWPGVSMLKDGSKKVLFKAAVIADQLPDPLSAQVQATGEV